VAGFALIWHIWWMLAVGLLGAFATFVAFAWRDVSEYKADPARPATEVAFGEGREPPGRDTVVPRAGSDDGYKGPASKRIITAYGFWIFLLSDFVLFAGFYAAFAVLSHATAGGPSATGLFDLKVVAIETALLLLSSFTCGMATLASHARSMRWTQLSYAVTGLLGVGFLVLERSEFARMLSAGAGPGRSAFLSAFFSLVGLHGLHVTIGLLWLGTMMAQFLAKGFRPDIMRRSLCFGLFWHALDIIWVGIFTNVYLLGTSS